MPGPPRTTRTAGRRGVRTGLRWRIAATIAAIVVVAVGVLGVAVHLLVTENRVQQARAAADERMAAALEIYGSTGLISFDARLDDPAVPAELRNAVSANGSRGTLVSGRTTRQIWAAGRSGSRILSLHTVIDPYDEGVQAVDQALLIAGATTVVVASLIGAVSANRLARRLRLAARTARTVTEGADRALLRAAVGPGQDEVGDLADAVDAMATRLADRLQSEQRFTADVAHDLRTPVTGLITAAALLDDSRPAVMVRDRADALAALIEDLLEVARLDTGAETAELEPVELAAVVDRTVHRGVAAGEFGDDDLLVTHRPPRLVLNSDPRRLERILSNLIKNALRHGGAPVEITTSGSRLLVTDHGPGFPAELLTAGPQRFRRAGPERAGGYGLGLVIVAGQAAVLGATVTFSNGAEGGARVSVDVPERDRMVTQL